MSKYQVKLADPEGKISTEFFDVANKAELYQKVREHGGRYVSSTEMKEGAVSHLVVGQIEALLSRVSAHSKIIFARNLAAMLSAGLSLTKCFGILVRQTKNKRFKEVIGELNEEVSRGGTFSSGLARFPDVFSPLFVSMVRAGEESGKLSESLTVVANQMEKNYLLTKKVKGAMIYPSVIMVAMMGIGILMFIFVVPTLTSTFKDLNVELPASTQLIITVSDFISGHTILFLGIIFGFVASVFFATKFQQTKRAIEYIVLHLPVIGLIDKEINSARTARTLSSLLSAGIEVVHALSITSEVVQNSFYKKIIAEAGEVIQKGRPMSEVFVKNEHLYPLLVGEMIAVGEETGEVSGMLARVAEFYENEVEQKTKDLSTIIEPVLMIIIGGAVGFFAVAMMGPTYKVLDTI